MEYVLTLLNRELYFARDSEAQLRRLVDSCHKSVVDDFKISLAEVQKNIAELTEAIKGLEDKSKIDVPQPQLQQANVNGSLPHFDVAEFKKWMSGWVEQKHIAAIAEYVAKKLGGNDR